MLDANRLKPYPFLPRVDLSECTTSHQKYVEKQRVYQAAIDRHRLTLARQADPSSIKPNSINYLLKYGRIPYCPKAIDAGENHVQDHQSLVQYPD